MHRRGVARGIAEIGAANVAGLRGAVAGGCGWAALPVGDVHLVDVGGRALTYHHLLAVHSFDDLAANGLRSLVRAGAADFGMECRLVVGHVHRITAHGVQVRRAVPAS